MVGYIIFQAHVTDVTLKIALNIQVNVSKNALFIFICMLAQVYILLLTRLPILRIHLINALTFNCYMCYQRYIC